MAALRGFRWLVAGFAMVLLDNFVPQVPLHTAGYFVVLIGLNTLLAGISSKTSRYQQLQLARIAASLSLVMSLPEFTPAHAHEAYEKLIFAMNIGRAVFFVALLYWLLEGILIWAAEIESHDFVRYVANRRGLLLSLAASIIIVGLGAIFAAHDSLAQKIFLLANLGFLLTLTAILLSLLWRASNELSNLDPPAEPPAVAGNA